MENRKPYGKFHRQQKRIKELESSNSRFRRIYSEYEFMSQELWNLENADGPVITEDFLNSVKLQTSFLEDEVEDWLLDGAAEILED